MFADALSAIWCLHVWSFGVPPRHGKLLKLLFPHIRKGPIFGKLLKLLGDGLSVVFEAWWAVELLAGIGLR